MKLKKFFKFYSRNRISYNYLFRYLFFREDRMLEICSDSHDEICYNRERTYYDECPVCKLIQEHSELLKEKESIINDKNDEISTLEDTIANLESNIENLRDNN